MKYDMAGITINIIGLYDQASLKFNLINSVNALVNPHPGQFTSNKKLKMQGIVISTPCIFKIMETMRYSIERLYHLLCIIYFNIIELMVYHRPFSCHL